MKKQILTILAICVSSLAFGQIPTSKTVYGRFIFQPGYYNISGASPAMTGASKRLGSLLKFSATIIGERSFSEVHTDIVSGGLLSLPFGGIDYIPSLFSTRLNGLDESKLNSSQRGKDYKLVFSKASIIGVSQSFKTGFDIMIGYHLGWEGINSSLIDNDKLVKGLDGALNLNYLNIGPSVALQGDATRIEAKYGFLRAPTIDKSGSDFQLSADYFISNDSESLAATLGFFVNTMRISTNDERPNVQDFSLTSVGLRLSFLYPSLLSLF